MIGDEEAQRPHALYKLCELRTMRSVVRMILMEDLVAEAYNIQNRPSGHV